MDIESMRQYLGVVSIFGDPAPLYAVVLILGVDLTLTLVHTTQEYKGRLWSYFGGIAGVQIPNWLGIPLFTVLLTLVLWTVGFAGIAGVIPFPHAAGYIWGVGALGLLLGCRFSDGLFSHLLLRKKYSPNPGIKSVPYYFAEVLVLLVVFLPGLRYHFSWAAAGFVIGFLAFYVILPGLRLFRTREPWQPGTPRPAWAQ